MRVHLGDWWTTDDRGQLAAHRVGAAFPDLRGAPRGGERPQVRLALMHDYSFWLPLCQIQTPSAACEHHAYPAMFSTFMPWDDHQRCSTCEVLSPAFDCWLAEGQSRAITNRTGT
ncbi:hypothetical protein BKG82_26295 [Mycobacteroides chelonae]|uniref:Uncharacterized protein n=1 Tax=Mycobacteroides chelonae TaxID=1774 RepID=A0A1S1LFS8_MYCCH|nr:hypothetical protein [Mycobacteroides chelonae]OHU47170.1 hypothetical protein BKG82_26295 [Mycobacteroides chelonae]